MNRHFDSLGAFAVHLLEREVAVAEALHLGLERVATHIEKTAKAEMGHYQPATGPFDAWPELADATKEDRLRQGYTENDPLYRSGETAETIGHQVDGHEAVIGSPDEKMVWFECGTEKMPARPVFGPAAFNNKDFIQKVLGAATVAGLIGADVIHPALGYDFETKE